MTDDLYLVAHKVRGEPAFDIATRMPCGLCAGHGHDLDGVCHECDSLGYWWIIPTSGHRAFPYASWDLDHLYSGSGNADACFPIEDELAEIPMPPDLPDHYTTREAPTISLISALGIRPAALPPLKRRF